LLTKTKRLRNFIGPNGLALANKVEAIDTQGLGRLVKAVSLWPTPAANMGAFPVWVQAQFVHPSRGALARPGPLKPKGGLELHMIICADDARGRQSVAQFHDIARPRVIPASASSPLLTEGTLAGVL